MTHYPIAVSSRALMVIEEEPTDLLSKSMEAEALRINQETLEVQNEIQYYAANFNRALTEMSFRFPQLAERLREQMNRIADLKGMAPIPEHCDPVTQRDEKGEVDPDVQAELDKQKLAIEEDIQRQLNTDQGKQLQKECRKMFQWISSRTHPDKAKDRSLHPVFDMARKALRDNNLQLLQNVKNSVVNYLSIRKKNKTFQAYLAGVINSNRAALAQALEHRAQMKQTVQYACLKALDNNDVHGMHTAYAEFIAHETARHKQIADNLEQQLEAQRRPQPSVFTFNF